jgi:uncharacterized protein (DUF3820 family)
MLLLVFSLILALLAGLGRQIVVFTRFKAGLWLFPNWHWVRPSLVGLSGILAILGALQAASGLRPVLLIPIILLNGFAFFFEMSFFFPEVKAVQRLPGEDSAFSPAAQVLGLVVEGVPVAYPIEEIVMPRHIVHDTVKGRPVLITYCALCRSALAFDTEIDGQELYFKVAGVWRRNMIMIDTQTRSIWQQATGNCIFGKHKGRQLTLLPAQNTIWKSWQNEYPNSEVASGFEEARKGLLPREKMLAGLKFATSRVILPGLTDLRGLPKRETVFGVAINGQSKAYPQSRLTDGQTFEDRVGGIRIDLTYDAEAENLRAVSNGTGESIPVERHWWLGWKEFHPETEIWQPTNSEK